MNLQSIAAKIQHRKTLAFLLIFYCALIWFFLADYEIQVSSFAAKLTNFAVGNGWHIRSYDENGIPHSHLARLRKTVISPYYVVHTGLMYSQALERPDKYNWLWQEDFSFEFWDESPPEKFYNSESFLYSANWILSKMQPDNYGNIHIFYDFDFPYSGTEKGYLKAPWYSGLTDAIAIKLLLRAYVLTNNLDYFAAATNLYKSVLMPMSQGGALCHDKNGNPWIEEYIAENNAKTPYVLNGMIYSTLAVICYEKFVETTKPMGPKLLYSIKKILPDFDTGYWTRYDLLGTVAKPKYHLIHVALMKQLHHETNDSFFLDWHKSWKSYNAHFFTRYFIWDKPTLNSLVIACLSFAAWIILSALSYLICLKLFFFKSLTSDSRGQIERAN